MLEMLEMLEDYLWSLAVNSFKSEILSTLHFLTSQMLLVS